MLQSITAAQAATFIFLTLLMVIIMFIGHHLYSSRLTQPRRNTKPHNDLAQYYNHPKTSPHETLSTSQTPTGPATDQAQSP